ncbi:uncharacterized protein MKZ38_003476 [Zalerion maritima]|uniref:Uncharacterized protein n=1 Tax=Zalerion maritima TaxID=339359 RepID=A0AAD5RYX6_9PEZI|nr:uncharacterized protein MKZ38_003476 [Zalerion maritima]
MGKFELPALDFQFSSLTEGTDIPAPEPSPVLEIPTPPKTPKPENKEAKTNRHQSSPTSNADSSNAGVKRPHDDVPVSPSLSSHGSIRHLISKTLLNNSYVNGEHDATGEHPSRPESRATTVGASEKKSRRASGFFRKLRGGDREQKRASVAVAKTEENPVSPPKPKGPPPPMIPELSALESKVDVSDRGSLGGDLFKNI